METLPLPLLHPDEKKALEIQAGKPLSNEEAQQYRISLLNRVTDAQTLKERFERNAERNAGLSLLEVLVSLAILLTVAGIGIPIVMSALESVRGFMALVAQVVVR